MALDEWEEALVIVTLGLVAVAVVAILAARRSANGARPWAGAERVLAWSAVAWSVSVTVYLLLAVTDEAITPEVSGGVAEQLTAGRRTFLDANGGFGLVFVLIPIGLTALPWLVSESRTRRRLLKVATVLLLTFVVVGALSVALLYAPSAVAMLIATALLSASGKTARLSRSPRTTANGRTGGVGQADGNRLDT